MRNALNIRIVLQAVFVGALITANLTASKLVELSLPLLGTVVSSAGVFAIGVTFFCTDLISELYGKGTARQTVNASVVAMVAAYALVFLAITLPAAPAYGQAEAFNSVFGASTPIVIASVLTIVVSQNLDVSIFHFIRGRTGDKYKFMRNIGSTGVSQLLDTSLFTALAFIVLPPLFGGAAVPLAVAGGIIGTEYVIKLLIAVLDTPLFYAITAILESE